MPRSSHLPRPPAALRAPVQQRLSAYSLVAGATGVSLLALAKPSEAQIVYTPANEVISRSVGTYGLDLNHDGIVDFVIADHRSLGSHSGESRQSLFVKPDASQNRIKCGYASCLSTFIYATALPAGSVIGNSQSPHGWLPGHAQMAFEERFKGKPYYFGAFNRVRNRYLGLQFQIHG